MILFVGSILTAGCKIDPLKVDPCAILPELSSCYAVPLNQPDKPEYERPLNAGDICVTADDYAKIQAYNREVLRRCASNCE